MNTTLTPADLDPRRQAMLLYFQGYRVARIAEMLGEKVATVHSWKKRDKWGDYGPLQELNNWLGEEVIRFETYDLGLKSKRG